MAVPITRISLPAPPVSDPTMDPDERFEIIEKTIKGMIGELGRYAFIPQDYGEHLAGDLDDVADGAVYARIPWTLIRGDTRKTVLTDGTGVYGKLPVASGGTGRDTLSTANVLMGNGTDPLSILAMTKGELVLGKDGAQPIALGSVDNLSYLRCQNKAVGWAEATIPGLWHEKYDGPALGKEFYSTGSCVYTQADGKLTKASGFDDMQINDYLYLTGGDPVDVTGYHLVTGVDEGGDWVQTNLGGSDTDTITKQIGSKRRLLAVPGNIQLVVILSTNSAATRVTAIFEEHQTAGQRTVVMGISNKTGPPTAGGLALWLAGDYLWVSGGSSYYYAENTVYHIIAFSLA